MGRLAHDGLYEEGFAAAFLARGRCWTPIRGNYDQSSRLEMAIQHNEQLLVVDWASVPSPGLQIRNKVDQRSSIEAVIRKLCRIPFGQIRSDGTTTSFRIDIPGANQDVVRSNPRERNAFGVTAH